MRPKSCPEALGTATACLAGQPISYTIRRSQRARLVRLEIKRATGLVITVPRDYDVSRLPALVAKRQRWIVVNLPRFTRERFSFDQEFREGDRLPYLGGQLRLALERDGYKCDKAILAPEQLTLQLPMSANAGAALARWYRSRARQLLTARLKELAPRMGLTYSRISVRDQSSRWASCSPQGNLSLNWRLITAPPEVIDYVLIHELAHRTELNHGPRFWKLVAGYCPEWRVHRRWLRDHE